MIVSGWSGEPIEAARLSVFGFHANLIDFAWQKKPPSGFAGLATRTRDHDPLMLKSSAYSFARPNPHNGVCPRYCGNPSTASRRNFDLSLSVTYGLQYSLCS